MIGVKNNSRNSYEMFMKEETGCDIDKILVLTSLKTLIVVGSGKYYLLIT